MILFKDTRHTVRNINIIYVDGPRQRDPSAIQAVDSAVRHRKGEAYITTEHPRKLPEEQLVLDRFGYRCRHCLCPDCERTRRKPEQEAEEELEEEELEEEELKEEELEEEKRRLDTIMNRFSGVL